MTLLASIWAFLNSPIGITLVVGLLGWLGTKFVTAKTLADKYLGTIIQTIKGLEKSIPGGTVNIGLERFDRALLLIVDYIEKVEDRDLSPTESIQIANAISVEHAKLEADGNLGTLPIANFQLPIEHETVELTAVGEAAAAAVAAGAEEEKTGGVARPTEFGPKINLNSIIVWVACVGMLLSMAAGCASDNATQIYGRAAVVSTALHESAIAYHVTAVAADVAPADRYAVEKRMDLVLAGVAAVVDSLQVDAVTYEAAVAAGSTADAEAANSRAKLSLNALNALATRLAAEMASP